MLEKEGKFKYFFSFVLKNMVKTIRSFQQEPKLTLRVGGVWMLLELGGRLIVPEK